MRRELWPSYLLVGGGLLAGLLVGGVLTSPEPAILGWLLGAGTGLTAGAFVAAVVAGVPLGGSGRGRGRRPPGGGGGGGHDPLAYLSARPAADIEPTASEAVDEEGEPAGLASLGRRGNGRAL
jgi:hypothetical protein